MSRRCPITGDTVLYLDCMECEDRVICKRGGVMKNREENIENETNIENLSGKRTVL